MATYTIHKRLHLIVEVTADSAAEAYEQMLDMDDNTFMVENCDYEVFAPGSDEPLDSEEYDA